MRMHHHNLSIEAWIQNIMEPNYFNWLVDSQVTDSLEGQVWVPQDPALLLQPATALQPEGPVALIPRNGDAWGGYDGAPDLLFKEKGDYINAGVLLCRRSLDTLEFLRQWYIIQKAEEIHRYKHIWEQASLNALARQKQWKGKVIIVPYSELTGPNGAMIRHVWGNLRKGTHHRVSMEALQEIMGLPQ
ncbi:unnamed protein product [Closterium sp. Yama58-4]|nr:unnamed protein product [Closterium sp. Yama58-4]